MPFLLAKTQLPPTRSEASKQVNGTPRSWSALAAAIPDEPAPMTAAVGRLGIAPASQKVTPASSLSYAPSGTTARWLAFAPS
jgi:hypothetical protein